MGRNGCVFKYYHEVVLCNHTNQPLLWKKVISALRKLHLDSIWVNPNKTTMGWIKVNTLKNLMKKRNVDVEVVDFPSILGSTEFKRELFLIQGYSGRGKK
jgi:hypothetical protein